MTALSMVLGIIIRALNHPAVQAVAAHTIRAACKALLNGTATVIRREMKSRGYNL